MVSVSEVPKKGFEEIKTIYKFFFDTITFKKLRQAIDSQKQLENKRRNSKVIAYLRFYSHLNEARNRWRSTRPHKGASFLQIVRVFAKDCPFKEEEPYYNQIHELMKIILTEAKDVTDPESKKKATSRVKIRIRMAENICMLRLLKVYEK